MAEGLGMTVGSIHNAVVAKAKECGGWDSFKSQHTCESVDELLGYLKGVIDARRVESIKPASRVPYTRLSIL